MPGSVWAVKNGTHLFNAFPMRHASTRGRLAGTPAGNTFGKQGIKVSGFDANKWSGGFVEGCLCATASSASTVMTAGNDFGSKGTAFEAAGMDFEATLGRVTSMTIGTVVSCKRRAS